MFPLGKDHISGKFSLEFRSSRVPLSLGSSSKMEWLFGHVERFVASSRQQQTLPFLQLPPEIRNQIYGLVFSDFKGQVLKEPRQKTQLLLTCHQIHDEAKWIHDRTDEFGLFNYDPRYTRIQTEAPLLILPRAHALRILPIARRLHLRICMSHLRIAHRDQGFSGPEYQEELYFFQRDLRLLCTHITRSRCNSLRTLIVTFCSRDLRCVQLGHEDEGHGELDLLAAFKEIRADRVNVRVTEREPSVDSKTQKYLNDVIRIVDGRHQNVENWRLRTFYRDLKAYIRALRTFGDRVTLEPILWDSCINSQLCRAMGPLAMWLQLPVPYNDGSRISMIHLEQCFAGIEKMIMNRLPLSICERIDGWQGVIRARVCLMLQTRNRDLLARFVAPKLDGGSLVMKVKPPVQREDMEKRGWRRTLYELRNSVSRRSEYLGFHSPPRCFLWAMMIQLTVLVVFEVGERV